ncbi:hypothetical protein [Vibrio rotiferianus]|uniref:hypothetical protein n=1 Tax=Vibrio rotiferianus TaxID=190895 RepID=UPI003909572A
MKEQLSELIAKSTSAIGDEYFQLMLDGGDPVYRERVYCYELYHQMRILWDIDSPFRLNGEVDKAAHPILRELGADHVKPDFLVHTPGDMNGNHAIIEVKHKQASRKGIKKDLESLSLFRLEVGYERAIYLVYGYDLDIEYWIQKVGTIANSYEKLAMIELWVHMGAGSPAIHVATVGNV